MGLSKEGIKAGLDHAAALEPRLAAAIETSGYPEPRIRPEGYETLLRTIVGQQVSVASAAAVWTRLEARLGDGCPPEALIATEFDELRACGLSRQKQGYARSLAELILSGSVDLENLPEDDEEAIALLTRIRGIGRWSAEIYLLFAQGRPDIWPAGDLAIQVGVGNFLDLPERPSEKELRDIAESWSPHRGAVAIFTWHHYHVMVM
ncbi:DNA-3-methyladenine glycosylase family protein [Sphingorhabdus sp. 109]|jgi:DNA-3-methyladenine glycosylase II|uniref:DNA-3-methyladenine glycosylase family protein n=1 Tax=Sphingorhabdus sp. 109 TaxID=2653173 RepID=UPI0012F470FF|nr:DNA-3-methyladenine glycosylase [Sphingorhabdus sp. 109]VWX55830.1 DNA-3-methyladenine glycosylase 2 [Sphingorhabdus sp. 109]